LTHAELVHTVEQVALLGAGLLHHFGLGAFDELRVAQARLHLFDFSLQFREFLLQAFALAGDIDQPCNRQVDLRAVGGVHQRAFRRLPEAHLLTPRQVPDGCRVPLQAFRARVVRRVHPHGGDGDARCDFHLRAQVANGADALEHLRDLRFGVGVNQSGVSDGEARSAQRRLGVRRANRL